MNKFNILGSVNPPMNNSPLTLDVNIIDCDSNNFFADNEAVETKRIELLAEEIKETGFRSVIEVRQVNDRYCTVAGETRLRALKLLYEQTKDPKYQFIPCFVNKDDENAQRRRLIMDNLLQREITPAIRMKAIEELQRTYQAEKAAGQKLPGRISHLIAQDIGLGKTQVGTYQTVINKGSEAVKSAVEKSDITVDAAAKLSSLPKQEQEEFIEQNDDYSLEAVTSYVKDKKNQKDDEYIKELSIYDYIDDDQCDFYEENQHNDEDLCDKDKAIIKDVLEILSEYTQNLKFARTRLHSLSDHVLAPKAEVLIEEMQDLYNEILKVLQY